MKYDWTDDSAIWQVTHGEPGGRTDDALKWLRRVAIYGPATALDEVQTLAHSLLEEITRLRTPQGHCGYANYPTFTVAMWINSDRKLLSMVRDVAAITADGPEEHKDVALAGWLRAWTESRLPDGDDSPSVSLLNYAMNAVDWMELARKYLEERK